MIQPGSKIDYQVIATTSMDRLVACPKITFVMHGSEFHICILGPEGVDIKPLGELIFNALKRERTNKYQIVLDEIKNAVMKSSAKRRRSIKLRNGRVPINKIRR